MAARSPKPLNVLQVASSLRDWGGIERYVHYLSDGLTERGHKLSVTCPPDSPLFERLTVGKIPLVTKGKFNPAMLAKYLRLFRHRRFDIIHIHFSPDFIAPAYAAKMAKQGKVVMTRHLVLPWKPRKVRLYTRLFDHIIPVSDAVRRKLADSGVPDALMTVAKAGCPAMPTTIDRTAARLAFNIHEGSFAVGSFGRLVAEKGIDNLIKAARSFPPNVTVEIFGDGPAAPQLQILAQNESNINFHGFVTNAAEAMAAMDCIAIPSVWEEAFPYAALEAMSAAKPIVASNLGGLPELVEEGKNGLLFESDDLTQMAEAVAELAGDPQRASKLGEEGRRIHANHYTIERMAERIEAVYNSL